MIELDEVKPIDILSVNNSEVSGCIQIYLKKGFCCRFGAHSMRTLLKQFMIDNDITNKRNVRYLKKHTTQKPMGNWSAQNYFDTFNF